MPSTRVVTSVPVVRTPRVQQLEGLFDVAPTKQSEFVREIHVPIETRPWSIGLIVGRSGSGKSTVARHLFREAMVDGFEWPADKSIVDAFPQGLSIKELTGLLSSVGFSSPPSWLRPFRCLSNGEQFRVTLARALAEPRPLVVIDEFTSVVDRTVAKIGSAAVAKAVRRSGKQFVAVACHYDIIEWLDPDWTYEPEEDRFHWRSERGRPPIPLTIVRVHHSAWKLFRRYHYLSHQLHKGATCFVALYEGQPVAFSSVLYRPGIKTASGWREHRTVCLPDFQGVGIGNAVSEYVASLYASSVQGFTSTTGNPSMIAHRQRSPLWRMARPPSMVSPPGRTASAEVRRQYSKCSMDRMTAGFRYIGPARPVDARRFGLRLQLPATSSDGTENKPSRPRTVTGSRSLRTLSSRQQKGPTAKGSARSSSANKPSSGTTSTRSTTAITAPATS